MKSILIIDDELSVREGLTKHVNWERLQIQVIGTASNGKQALQKMEEQLPDIVITDIYMPEMDGLTLIKEVNEKHPYISIIIHSGYNHFDNARKAIQYGVKHFFLKPSPVTEIETVLQEVVQEIEAEEMQQTILETYREQRPVYLTFRKDSFIRNLLFNRYVSKDLTAESQELIGGLVLKHPQIVTSIMINRPPYLTKVHERDWQLLKFSVGNILSETMKHFSEENKLTTHLVDYSDSTYVMVVFLPENSLYLEQLNDQLVHKMLENVLYYLKVSVMLGVSSIKSNLHLLTDAYLESMQALEVAEYEEWNKVYYYQDTKSRASSEVFVYPFETIKEIHGKIADKEYEQLLAIWHRFVNGLSEEKYSPPFYMIQTISINILSALMMDDHSMEHIDEKPLEKSSILIEVYNYNTINKLLSWTTEQLTKWVEHSKEKLASKKTSKLVERVKEHIHQYYDQEITLTEIADSFYVNRNYLSQLFKKITGETFVNYLNNYRIAKAKELLKEKRYMVYEVSEMVGYQNSTYFSQVFKAITGVSPSEYF
ncbi:DNA-binding response regulator [Gracilibacillus boraciitolerans JCM 21714]|uniref:DNA-binding response regulator n=1 Tax=Gracilibacillus boraciitolerans JCM 21714 TaxID=1298598 RepID=W4VJR5_9BACI|nr:response regulator [Gracilibacillus boraciitolerans]GAE93432.1 DNA-binding response regulator [Gracilibacillus boraciitolerans JCM 21714]